MNYEKEEQQLVSRLRDLANQATGQSRYTYSMFLGLDGQDIFHRMERELSFADPKLWGGYEGAERQILRMGVSEDLGYEEKFPIACLHISPSQEKFADPLTHRDFLGALMNLGIDRGVLGDIRVGEKEAWLFCQENIAPFLCENLLQVKHTRVKCREVKDPGELPVKAPVREEMVVSSERADTVVSRIYHLSRGESQELFVAGKIYVNGRLCTSPSGALKEGETISVRGYGRFVYLGIKYETKKGKLCAQAAVYR